MADFDPMNLTGSAEGYASPEEVNQARALAAALVSGKSGQQVPYHWTQAVSNVLHSLRGESMLNKANRNDRSAGSAAAKSHDFGQDDTQASADGYDQPDQSAQKKTLRPAYFGN